MNIKANVLELIGNTPLVRLQQGHRRGQGATSWLKLESRNPLSSVKDRIALSMIEDAEKRGLLKKGSVIVEPTSGNTGIGLAYVVGGQGIPLHPHDAGKHEHRAAQAAEGLRRRAGADAGRRRA